MIEEMILHANLDDYIGVLHQQGRLLYQQEGNHRNDLDGELDLMRRIEQHMLQQNE